MAITDNTISKEIVDDSFEDKRRVRELRRVKYTKPEQVVNIERTDEIVHEDEEGNERIRYQVKEVSDTVSGIGGIHVLVETNHNPEEGELPIHLRCIQGQLGKEGWYIEGIREHEYSEIKGVDYDAE